PPQAPEFYGRPSPSRPRPLSPAPSRTAAAGRPRTSSWSSWTSGSTAASPSGTSSPSSSSCPGWRACPSPAGRTTAMMSMRTMTENHLRSKRMSNPFGLTGRTALVTGGYQGLGKAFARGLPDAGASVVIAARNAERSRAVVEEFAADGLTLFAVTADITDTADIDRMVTEAIDAVGRIDLLENNAGTCSHAPAFDVTDQEWDDVFDRRVTALRRAPRAVGAHVAELGGGSLVNIGAMSGLIVNRPPLATGLQRREGSGAPAHEIPRRGMGVAEHPRQRGGTRLRKDGDGPRGPSRVPALLDRGRSAAALRPAGGDRPERGLPGERRRVLHHRHRALGRRRVHRGLTVSPPLAHRHRSGERTDPSKTVAAPASRRGRTARMQFGPVITRHASAGSPCPGMTMVLIASGSVFAFTSASSTSPSP